jgi:hypothetical protein
MSTDEKICAQAPDGTRYAAKHLYFGTAESGSLDSASAQQKTLSVTRFDVHAIFEHTNASSFVCTDRGI